LAGGSAGDGLEIIHVLEEHAFVGGGSEDGAAVEVGIVGLSEIGLKRGPAGGVVEKREDDVAETWASMP